jgi:3-methyladenine DNA glycosylase AlkD
MLAYLRDSPHGGEVMTPMRDLATAADQVKFAKGEALRDEGERHLEATRNLVRKLEERLAPPPLKEAAGGEAGRAA